MKTQHQCKPGPGKFEGESALAIMAYESALLGCADATTYDDCERTTDWFCAPLNFDADSACVDALKQHGFCDACIEAAIDEARELAGVALYESDQGFVYLATYETREAFDAALVEAEQYEAECVVDDDAEESN